MSNSRRQSVVKHFPTVPIPSPELEGSIPITYRSQRDAMNIPSTCDTAYLSNDVAALGSTMNATSTIPGSISMGRNNIVQQLEDYKRILDSIGQPNYATIKNLFDPNERHGTPPEIVPTVQISFELFEAVQNRLAATRKTLDRTKGDLFTRNQQYTVLLSEMQALKDEYAALQKRTLATESGNLSLHQQVAKQDVALEQLNKEIGQVHLDMDMLIQKLKRRDEELQDVRNRMAEGLVFLSQKDNAISALRRELEKYTQPVLNFNDKDSTLAMLDTNSSYSAEMLQNITDNVHGRTERARMKLSVADLEAKVRRLEEEKNSIVVQHDSYLAHVQDIVSIQEHRLLSMEDAISAHVCAPESQPLVSQYYSNFNVESPDTEDPMKVKNFALFGKFPELLQQLGDIDLDNFSKTMREGMEGCIEAQRGCVLVSQELSRFLSIFERGMNGDFLSIHEVREEWAKMQPSHFASHAGRELQRCASDLGKALLAMGDSKQGRGAALEERKSTPLVSARRNRDTGAGSEVGGVVLSFSGRSRATGKRGDSRVSSGTHSSEITHREASHAGSGMDARVSWRAATGQNTPRSVSSVSEAWNMVSTVEAPPMLYRQTHCPHCHASLLESDARGRLEEDGAPLGSPGVSKEDINASGASRTRLSHNSSESMRRGMDANRDNSPLPHEDFNHDSATSNANTGMSVRETMSAKASSSCSEDRDDAHNHTLPLRRLSSSIPLSKNTSVRTGSSRPHAGLASASTVRSTHSKGHHMVPTSSRRGSLQSIKRELSSRAGHQKDRPLSQRSLETSGAVARDRTRGNGERSLSRRSSISFRTNHVPPPVLSSRVPSVNLEHPNPVRTSQRRSSVSMGETPQILESEDCRRVLRALSNVLNADASSSAFTRSLQSGIRIRGISNNDNSDKDITMSSEIAQLWDAVAFPIPGRVSSAPCGSRQLSNTVVAQLEERMASYTTEIETLSRELEELRAFKAHVEAAAPLDDAAALPVPSAELERSGGRGALPKEASRGSEHSVSRDSVRHSEVQSSRSYSSVLPAIPSTLQHTGRSLSGITTDLAAQRSQSTHSVPAHQGLGLNIRKISISVPDDAITPPPITLSSARTTRTISIDGIGETHSQLFESRNLVGGTKLREVSARPPLFRGTKSTPSNEGSRLRLTSRSLSPGASVQESSQSRLHSGKPTPQLTSQKPTASLSGSRTQRPPRGPVQAIQPRTSSGANVPSGKASATNKTRFHASSTDNKYYYAPLDNSAQLSLQSMPRGAVPHTTNSADSSNLSRVVVVGSRVAVADSARASFPAVEEREGKVAHMPPYAMSNFRESPSLNRSNLHLQSTSILSASAGRPNKRYGLNFDAKKNLAPVLEETHTTSISNEKAAPKGLIIHSFSLPHPIYPAPPMPPGLSPVRKEEPHHPIQQEQKPSPFPSPVENRTSVVDAPGLSISHLNLTPRPNVEEEQKGAAAVPPRTTPCFMFLPTYNYFAELQSQIKQLVFKEPAGLASSFTLESCPRVNPSQQLSPRLPIRKPGKASFRTKIHLAMRYADLNGHCDPGLNTDLPSKGTDHQDSQDLLAKGSSIKLLPELEGSTRLSGAQSPSLRLNDSALLARRALQLGALNQRYQRREWIGLLRKHIRRLKENERRNSDSGKRSPRSILSISKPYCVLDARQTTTSLPILRRMLHARRSRFGSRLSAKKKDKNIRWRGGHLKKNEEE